MTRLAFAGVGAYGVYLAYTALAFGWHGGAVGPKRGAGGRRRRAGAVARWLAQAGLGDVRPRDFVVASAVVASVGALATLTVFGGILPALAAGAFAGTAPAAMYRGRRERRRADAREAWPRMIEEIRLQTGALGRSVPQALFDVGRRGPAELRAAFATAEREWLLTTDFTRTVAVLKTRLADPTADAALETLLVAHDLGGTDLDRRLVALADDRVQDLHGRKDAEAKQAGVRFARRFVLVVPVGMALAGLSIGSGRDAYKTAAGQIVVAIGIALVVACWVWAGQLLKLPQEERVFNG
jgi:tight adherence protein B